MSYLVLSVVRRIARHIRGGEAEAKTAMPRSAGPFRKGDARAENAEPRGHFGVFSG